MEKHLARPALLAMLAVVVTLLLLACGTRTPAAAPGPDQAGDVTPTPTSPKPTPTTEQETSGAPLASLPRQDDLAEYFSSRPITIAVGYSPGGGYDLFSRLFARFAPRYLPGNPEIIIENLPGSGGEIGLRRAMTSAPDGRTIGILHPRFAKRELLGVDVPDFDLSTVILIGSPSATRAPGQYYIRRAVATTWDEVEQLGRAVTNGETEPGASSGLGPEFIELTGGPMRLVYGYGGTSEILAAVDRGELDGASSGIAAILDLFPEWAADQFIVPLFWWGADPAQDPVTLENYRSLGVEVPPYLFDIYSATDTQREAFELTYATNTTVNRTFVMPPGVPDNVVEAWRTALRQVMEDPEFIEAANVAGYEVGFGDPDTIQAQLTEGQRRIEGDPEFRMLFEQLAKVD